MAQDFAPNDFSNLRRAERDEVFLRISLTVGRKTGLSAQLVNISPYGFMARTLEPLSPESRIRIPLPLAGEMAAKIVWSLGGRIGGLFEVPIDEKDYPKVLAAIKAAKPNWQSSIA